jgi:hypothetical protein
MPGPDPPHSRTQDRRGETTVAFDILKDIAGAAGLEALGDEASKLFHGSEQHRQRSAPRHRL